MAYLRRPIYVAVATATLTVFVGAGSFALAGRDGDPPAADTSASTTATIAPPARTYADNRAAAAAESARVVNLLRLPAGAVRLRAKPTGWPRDSFMTLGPSDVTLTTTSWWSVSVDSKTLARFLLDHPPPGMSRDGGVGGGPDGIRDVIFDPDHAARPDAFLGVSLLVQWLEIDGRSLVRADTFTGARAIRTDPTFVTGSVTAVDIDRVESGLDRPGGPLPTVHLTQPADRDVIVTLVKAANDLPASMQPRYAGSCPMPGDPPPSLTLTFHTTRGTVGMHLPTWCWGQVEVSRDGKPLTPTLDPGDLVRIVEDLSRFGCRQAVACSAAVPCCRIRMWLPNGSRSPMSVP